MTAPAIVWIAPGIGFVPPAADSFRRFTTRLGRTPDTNSTYRDYDKQMGMYKAWNAWVSGRGPKPNHSRAVHPDDSDHCKGIGWDSDEWTSAEFNDLAAEYGFIRTAADDPTERHHYTYQSWRDQHRNDPQPANPITLLGDPMSLRIIDSPFYRAANHRVIHNGQAAMSVPAGWVQDMIARGHVDYAAYDDDNLLDTEVRMVWQLGGYSTDAAAAKTTAMIKDLQKGNPA